MLVWIFQLDRQLKQLRDSAESRSAQETILRAVKSNADFYSQELADRDSHLFNLDQAKPADGKDDVDGMCVSLVTPNADNSLKALHQVDPRVHCVMPYRDKLPRFKAWVPCNRSLFVTDADIETFIPWFGATKKDLELAAEVYEQMREDTEYRTPFNEASDGEINEVGELQERRTPQFFAMHTILNRASIRNVLVSITTKFGKSFTVWDALSEALHISDIPRLQYMCDLAERRNAELEKLLEKRRKLADQSRLISNAVYRPSIESTLEVGREGHAGHPLQQFCFFCHEFGCQWHEGKNVTPLIPIPDRIAEERNGKYGNRKQLSPCSRKCYLLDLAWRTPLLPGEGQPWSSDEICMLTEGVTIFLKDPCGLSTIIGSKTCREVRDRMLEPDELRRLEVIIEQSKMTRDPNTAGSSKTWDVSSHSGEDDDVPVKKKKKRGRRPRFRHRIKSVCQVSKDEPSEQKFEDRFVPCNHIGSCARKNACRCAIKGIACESVCGCSSGRFVQGKKGMMFQPPSEEELQSGCAEMCKLLQLGCMCSTASCVTEECPCYACNRVCNGDFCNSCRCSVLPSDIGIYERQCRNSDVITGRHKKTFVGNSTVHGYGLFAGEAFRKGDLIGPYNGRLMSSELLDQALRIPQAKRETFAFQLYSDASIDGGVLGSKMKFMNHKEAGHCNCESRTERFRGEMHIVLKASRDIKVGEELFFNYSIIDEGGAGNKWLEADGGESEEEDSDSEGDSDSEENSNSDGEEREGEKGMGGKSRSSSEWGEEDVTRRGESLVG